MWEGALREALVGGVRAAGGSWEERDTCESGLYNLKAARAILYRKETCRCGPRTRLVATG